MSESWSVYFKCQDTSQMCMGDADSVNENKFFRHLTMDFKHLCLAEQSNKKLAKVL